MEDTTAGLPVQKHGKVSDDEAKYISDLYNIMRCKIYNWRKELKMTRYEFARKCNIGVASVAGIEDRKIIEFSRIVKICMYTGKTMQNLFDETAFEKESVRELRMLEERIERFGFNVDKKDLEIQEENIRLKAESKKRHNAMLADMADKDIAAKEIEDANIRPR